VAAGYDTQRYMRVCASRLVELVGLPSGAKVLDVATGTGWAALAAARTVGATGQVVGVDLTPAMLEQARRKAAMAHLTNVAFCEGDAQRLDFPPHSFDAVLCASAIFFLPDMLAAVREWQRVTKPGGRVAFSTCGDTLFHPMRAMLNARLSRYGVRLPNSVVPSCARRAARTSPCTPSNSAIIFAMSTRTGRIPWRGTGAGVGASPRFPPSSSSSSEPSIWQR
jgi:ubiquinone/menaquinone biosynthesis C-methylase UbiE